MANSRYGLRTRLGAIRDYSQGSAGGDADANLFLDAAAITDTTITTAIQQLVIDLKAYGIWSKMKAIYPFVGGSAAAHKFNLKDARDLDAAFRLVFFGGWTHSSNGGQPNGINGYAKTFINLASNFTTTNIGVSVYKNLVVNGGSDVATFNSNNNAVFYNLVTTSSVFATAFAFSQSPNNYTPAFSGNGMHTTNALNGTTKGYENGSVKITATTLGSIPSVQSEIGRNTWGVEYSDSRYCLVAYHDGFTDTEIANLYTAVQAFQTTLGRQV